MSAVLHDTFTGSVGPLNGHVADTGQVWVDTNDTCALDGSGRYIRNPLKEGVAGGSYGFVTIDAPATHLYADVSFTGTSTVITENGALVLISGDNPARGNTPPTQGIFHRAIHAVFGAWQTTVAIWEADAGVVPDLIAYTYPGGKLALDGTIYRIGIYLDNQRIGVTMPDGALKWAADSRLPTYTGPYLIYQTYNGNAPSLRPRLEEVWAETTAQTFGVQGGRELVY